MKYLLLICLLFAFTNADIYLQSPRGSNNRLDEANRDRQNGNRLFDSQNNNRGGYNVGSVYYYEGSKVYMEWSVQHSCGNANTHCELVLQYMCDDGIRDGTTTSTIPTDPNNCFNYDCDNDLEYGRQESYEWYQQCLDTSRNKGLFTANQNLNNRHAAQYTRQNPDGTRRGYECPEERDYYPYWRPTPWRDIAIFTNEPERCAQYQAESQNVRGKYYCKTPGNYTSEMREANQKGFIPITKEECEELYVYDAQLGETVTGQWTMEPSWGIPAPECRQNQFSRDNHHGNIAGGFFMGYNWTVPNDIIDEQCIFRFRYNISTYDFEHWESAESIASGGVNASLNSMVSSPNDDEDPAWIPIWEDFGLTYEDVAVSFDESQNNDDNALKASRGYVHVNDPHVDIFGSILGNTGDVQLQINTNTAQFGRTFEDRSHRFAIRKRTSDLDETVIHNVQVRGKRGNIVQTYPGVEYDFVPNRLHVKEGEYVHFQWTGSDTNPNNNAGQGKQGTDRSNIVVQWGAGDTELIVDAENGYGPSVYDETDIQSALPTYGNWGTSFPANIQDTEFLGFSKQDMETLATLDSTQMGGELSELDDAGTYFDLGPRKATMSGIYHYLCTRNNNFSNRSQKGKIVVSTESSESAVVGWEGGSVSSGEVSVVFAEGATTEAVTITIVRQEPTNNEASDGYVSDFVYIYPLDIPTGDGSGAFSLELPYDNSFTMSGHTVYWQPDGDKSASYQDLTSVTDFKKGIATITMTDGGLYVVKATPISWLFIVLPIVCLLMVLAGYVYYKYKHRDDEKGYERN